MCGKDCREPSCCAAENLLDAREHFSGLDLNRVRRGDAAITIRRIDTGKKEKIADAHAMASRADGQREIGNADSLTIFAGRGNGIQTHAATAFETADADEIHGWRIVTETSSQRLGNGGSVAVFGYIDREADHVYRRQAERLQRGVEIEKRLVCL